MVLYSGSEILGILWRKNLWSLIYLEAFCDYLYRIIILHRCFALEVILVVSR